MLTTFEDAKEKLKKLREDNPVMWLAFRVLCSDDLARDWPEGEGLGSSDVSCHMIEVARYTDIERAVEAGRIPE